MFSYKDWTWVTYVNELIVFEIKAPRTFQRNTVRISSSAIGLVFLVLLMQTLQATFTLFSENEILIQRLQSVCLQIWRFSYENCNSAYKMEFHTSLYGSSCNMKRFQSFHLSFEIQGRGKEGV